MGTSICPSIGGGYAQVFDASSSGGSTSNLGAHNSSYVTNFSPQGVGLPAANMGLLSFAPILVRGTRIPSLLSKNVEERSYPQANLTTSTISHAI